MDRRKEIRMDALARFWHETLDSTQGETRRKINTLPMRALIQAGSQSMGKGRQGKRWLSAKTGNFYGTFLFKERQQRPVEKLRGMSLVAGLSVLKVLESYGSVCTLKWPNDVLINDQKIAGILMENRSWSGGSALLIGIGVNLNWDQNDGESVDQAATALNLEIGCRVSLSEFTDQLATQIENTFEAFIEAGFFVFVPEIQQKNALKGRDITVKYGNDLIKGKCTDIDSLGRLVIIRNNQEMLLETGEILEF